MGLFKLGIVGSALIALLSPVASESQVPAATAGFAYADLADLALPSPVVAQVRIARASRLAPAAAPGLRAGTSRHYVEAEIVTLLRSREPLGSSVKYLVDLPDSAPGRPAKLQKASNHLIFASTVPGRPGELRLTAPSAQIAFVPDLADRVRAIVREASLPNAAPRITGIGRAFHVPGSLPGESETQVFLQTENNRPVSLSILRRPGEAIRWSAALGEIVDEASTAPARDTLLWYRLACSLPAQLPQQSLTEVDPTAAAVIRTDYRIVLDSLGRCERRRT